jgi:hypothetical protein
MSRRRVAHNSTPESAVDAALLREVEDLLARSALMRRSRAALVRLIMDNPVTVVPAVVRAAADSPVPQARTAAGVLRSAIRRSGDGEVARRTLDEILVRPVRFPELGLELCALLLARQHGRNPLDALRVAQLWHRLGQFQAEADQPELAIASARRSLGILRCLAPRLRNARESIALRRLALVEHLESAGRPGAACRVAREALRSTKHLRGESGRRLHALLLVCLGTALAASGRYREAHPFAEEGYLRLRDLPRHDAHQISQVAHAAVGLAGVCSQRGPLKQLRRAGELAEEAWEIHRRLVAGSRGMFLRDYLSTSLLAGVIAARLGAPDKARARREVAVTHLLKLARQHPEAYLVEAAWHLVHVSQAFLGEGELQSAVRWSGAAVRTARKAERIRGAEAGEILAVSLLAHALARARAGQRRQARNCAAALDVAARALPRRHADRRWLLQAAVELGLNRTHDRQNPG